MKNLFIATLLACFASVSYAEPKNEVGEQQMDRYSQLCLAVLKSEKEFIAKARELHVTKSERNRLVCNDMSITQFADSHQLTDQNTIATVQ
ncbi:MAG: hypothetical protein ACI82A_001678 [Candidatus Azotimanducaceae bacterium]|jgi:hypothetical protein